MNPLVDPNSSYKTKSGLSVRNLRYDPRNGDFPIRGEYQHASYGWLGHAWTLHGRSNYSCECSTDLVEVRFAAR